MVPKGYISQMSCAGKRRLFNVDSTVPVPVRKPVRAWLRGLASEVRLEIGSEIEKVQWRWPISKPLVGSFGAGLYEVRTSIDGNIYRVFFCIIGQTMVLLHGFMKKTQRVPVKEADLARARQKEVQK